MVRHVIEEKFAEAQEKPMLYRPQPNISAITADSWAAAMNCHREKIGAYPLPEREEVISNEASDLL